MVILSDFVGGGHSLRASKQFYVTIEQGEL